MTQVRSGAAVTAGAALERLRVPTAAAAIHVEHALRLAVQLVGACAPHCAAAWQQLMDWVLPTARVLPEHSALHVVSAASATAAEDSSTGVPTPADGHLAGESAAGSSSQQLGAAVGASARVFDQEADNQHEEPLLLAQLAAQHAAMYCTRQGLQFLTKHSQQMSHGQQAMRCLQWLSVEHVESRPEQSHLQQLAAATMP